MLAAAVRVLNDSGVNMDPAAGILGSYNSIEKRLMHPADTSFPFLPLILLLPGIC